MSTFPPRCFTCGKVLEWNPYQKMVYDQHISKIDALDKLNHTRFCCRRMFLSHNPKIEDDKNLYSRIKNIM